MENKSFFVKNRLRLSHLPTLILIIGYICYWLELYFVKKGRGLTSPLAFILFISFAIILIFFRRGQIYELLLWFIGEYRKQGRFVKCILTASLFIVFLMFIITVIALSKPPHLCQEYDALNYHLTLPRQHLILGTFKHIRWSSTDLFPLPIQFALAPYWLIWDIPNKIIQIFFVFGLTAVVINLIMRFSEKTFLPVCIGAMAVLGSHSIGIQMPVLMLDIVLAYLFLAFLDSFLEGNYVVSAIELAFVTWSKTFFSVFIFFMFFSAFIICFIAGKFGINKIFYSFRNSQVAVFRRDVLLKAGILFIIFSIIIGGPFIIKSIYYAGTPLYPFCPGIINISNIDMDSPYWNSIVECSKSYISKKEGYGAGGSFWEFIRHLWILAVPEEGVINRFDYPLGLPYLLFLGPFLYLLIISFRKREIAILSIFVIAYWFVWWFSCQQARFLYIPLILMFILVASVIRKPSVVFMSALAVALLFNFISIFRAHYRDLVVPSVELLRGRDRKLLAMNKEYLECGKTDPVVLDFYDAAYAQFPIEVNATNELPWVLEQ